MCRGTRSVAHRADPGMLQSAWTLTKKTLGRVSIRTKNASDYTIRKSVAQVKRASVRLTPRPTVSKKTQVACVFALFFLMFFFKVYGLFSEFFGDNFHETLAIWASSVENSMVDVLSTDPE